MDDDLQQLQHEVQRLLGRCMLRLQQYERLIKILVAEHQIAGPVQEFEDRQKASRERTRTSTLGTLVKELTGSFLASDEASSSIHSPIHPSGQYAGFGMRFQLPLSADDYARTERELKELVLLRNNLVHHFIDEHHLGDADGCREARKALVAADSQIGEYFENLREWCRHLEQTRQHAARFVNSREFRDLIVNGIFPDGTVDWASAGIVDALREAAGELSVQGWTTVNQAAHWIAERHPEQRPEKYGCRSWRQVIHESGVFELLYREIAGKRTAFYRPMGGGLPH